MACLRAGRISARPIGSFIRPSRHSGALPLRCTALRDQQQTRPKYTSNRPTPHAATRQDSRVPQARNVTSDETQFAPIESGHGYNYSHVDEKIHYLRPAIWAIAVSSGIYVSLAYLEARQQSKSPPTLVSQVRQRIQSRPSGTAPQDVAMRWWQNQDPISRLSIGIIATNGAVHLGRFVAPGYWGKLWHTPIRNVNYTILTSTFVHSGPFHLFFNMWACYNFLLPTGYSRAFEGNPYHLGAFFVTTGILSGYAQHLSTIFSNTAKALQTGFPPAKYTPSGGASGALFGMFGVFCMQYPDAGVGIIFVPVYIAAQYFLPAIMAFDLYGMTVGFKRLNLGHAAHLGGAFIGAGYSYLDGKNRIWKPLVKLLKRRIQS